ncbi:alpha-L-rhamnosidase C-terminal domain-containing protein [Formosa sp. PL04]|uniref:alpha-L-rhamnosidase C-terminal domain-containing protein n=1 Tax=Formosa sp. PL04 TaxID=3081755 RepID=UPI00298287E1|nr:alpha-L-rhamnosidase C-terminal domain-containing protein [Formosa sp. PL04]MDW5288134.1 alpha-L-rhamnosidase C-terminal domain-containing protein [Formosa sp. PL04]
MISRNLWGIQPKTAGYSIASIQPQLASLKNSSIRVPTIRGEIKAMYSYVNARKEEYIIELPANMVAEFKLESFLEKEVILNGKKVNTQFDTIRLTPGKNQIELVVNSF